MIMSDFAFFRFKSNGILTFEEEDYRDEMIKITEEVLHANGRECDASVAKISEEELLAILAKVRELRKKRKGISAVGTKKVDDQEAEGDKEEVQYIR
jgi:hypothetical protein